MDTFTHTFFVKENILTIHTGPTKRWNPPQIVMDNLQATLVQLVKNHGRRSVIRFEGGATSVWATTLALMLRGLGEVTADKLKEVISFDGPPALLGDLMGKLPAAVQRLKPKNAALA